ncbi:MAG: hypothetical protein QE271_08710 [Bacteriovoracaceae bacterium]|nr:hypothetical protein [Bacteriovoracaceae bacterium]
MKRFLQSYRFPIFFFSLTYSLLFFYSKPTSARSYMIYSVAQDLPMGVENEKIRKNFYVNIGSNQGIKNGTELSVFRIMTRQNPFSTEKSVTFKVKVGELRVVHSEKEDAIAVFSKLNGDTDVYFDGNALMVGDQVDVKVKD